MSRSASSYLVHAHSSEPQDGLYFPSLK
jgi:hypothetical protein